MPRSPLIGRERGLAAVQQLLLQEQVGLLTLTGPGGIGKTRLAMQAAANLLDHFVDGVYFVSLAPISDPALVIAAIAQTLGVYEVAGRPLQETVQAYLRNKQLLLVLDNFEQVLAAAPLVAQLLTRCRRLKVLATSREEWMVQLSVMTRVMVHRLRLLTTPLYTAGWQQERFFTTPEQKRYLGLSQTRCRSDSQASPSPDPPR